MTMTTIANTSISMTSFDFLNTIINPAREAAGQKAVRHNDFLARAVDELDLDENLCYESFVTQSTGKMARPQEIKIVKLDAEQMMLMGMRESKAVRKAVLAKLKELQAENQMMGQALTEVTQAETLTEAQKIAERCLAKREFLRNTYKGEFTEVITESFVNRTSEGGRNVGQALMNHAKLVSLLATGMTPSVFKKANGMNPRDWALANNDEDLLTALNREEGKVVALSQAGMSYSQIKELLVKE